MIQGDAPWQARGKAGASGHELVGFHGGISGIEAGIALALPAAHHINNGDQTDFANSGHVHAALLHRVPTRHAVRLATGSVG